MHSTRAARRARTLAPAVAIALAAATASGCDVPASQSVRTAGASQAPATSHAFTSLASLAETGAPSWECRDLQLPAGCSVTDNTERLAAYEQSTWKPYPSSVIGLLDLTSGQSRTIVEQPVSAARRFDAFTPMLSDSWLVWEEVSPNESGAPRDAQWRLYAAAIDVAELRIGAPLLVDEGTTDYKLRPHYGVEDSTVYWSVTTLPSPHQEHVEISGRVESLDLRTGERSCVYRSQNPLLSLRVSRGHLVLIEDARGEWRRGVSGDAAGDEGRPGSPARTPPRHDRAVVVRTASGSEVLRYDLPSAGAPAHFADYADGWLAWAAFSATGDEWPDLFLRSPEGVVSLGGPGSIDPVVVGRTLAFESVSAVRRAGGMLDRRRSIWCVDLDRPSERFRIAESRSSEEGWWQTTRAGRTGRALVLWNDLGPWKSDPARARTLVRVYRVP